MASPKVIPPLIVIVGQTASGKSALAMELAARYNGELICADSRTLYKGMDLGTAKPTLEDQAKIRHHGIDVVSPDMPFTAAQFKQLAQAAIQDIAKRGKVPIVVGGTGLYVDAVIYDYQFRPLADPVERQRLTTLSVEELQEELRRLSIALPDNSRNPRHLIRAIETGGKLPERQPLRDATLIVGLEPHKGLLQSRVEKRTQSMIAEGLPAEVEKLAAKYGWDAPGMNAIGYREFATGLDNTHTAALIIRDTLMYAKRQRTWFRRNKSIQWVSNQDEAIDLVTTFMNKYKM